ncbi:MAG: response regulator [Bacteroidota bacterium]|nr:response regulator [Bacteroidota bacterium]
MDGKVSILIAEDNEQVGTTLLEHLTNKQYDATLALDGEQALNQMINKKFDVVILDLKMPKISGYGILKYIKSSVPATKVIVLTAYSDFKNIEECKRLGADHVIGNPYDMEILFWTIELVTAK